MYVYFVSLANYEYMCVCVGGGGGMPPLALADLMLVKGILNGQTFELKHYYTMYMVYVQIFFEEKQEGVPTMLLLQKNKRQEFLGSTKKKRTITIANELMTSIWIGFDSILILLCVEAISILACAQILELTIHIVASKSKND
jgi:hypothetical protein